jgi:hypothetical protein
MKVRRSLSFVHLYRKCVTSYSNGLRNCEISLRCFGLPGQPERVLQNAGGLTGGTHIDEPSSAVRQRKPGWLKTLNASIFNRKVARSLIGNTLYKLAFMLVSQGPGITWLRNQFRPLSKGTTTCDPSFKVSVALLVS